MSEIAIEFEPARHNVVYGTGGGIDLHCDIYTPPQSGKRAAIIHIHGGGFRGGSKEAMKPKVQAYTRLGYVSVAMQYRLAGQAKWPAQIEDVKCCIRWVRANAQVLGIDPTRIAVAGYSAGGHLAMMASVTHGRADLEGAGGNDGVSSDIAACIAYYPQYRLSRTPDGPAHLVMPEGATDDDHAAASPINNVGPQSAPTVLLHGTADVTILPAASHALYDALIAANVPAELHTIHGVPHEFDRHPEFATHCAAIADHFFDRVVLNPRTYPPFAPGEPAPRPN